MYPETYPQVVWIQGYMVGRHWTTYQALCHEFIEFLDGFGRCWNSVWCPGQDLNLRPVP